MVSSGPTSSKIKSGIGRKRKNEPSFQRHKDVIFKTEVVDQLPDENNSAETTQPSQKLQSDNQWRAARGIVSCDNLVQQIMMESD